MTGHKFVELIHSIIDNYTKPENMNTTPTLFDVLQNLSSTSYSIYNSETDKTLMSINGEVKKINKF